MTEASYGVLAGEGELPELVVEELNRQNYDVVAGYLSEAVSTQLKDLVAEGRTFRPEQFGQVPEFFLEHGVNDLVMVGSVDRTVLYDEDRLQKADETVLSELSETPSNRDETLLESAVEVLESFGLNVQGIDGILADKLAPSGHQDGPEPDRGSLDTLNEIAPVAVELADREVGQTVLGKNQSVVAVEAAEGTNRTIRRAADLAGPGLVMIKVARSDQDFRLDVPVVGASTVSELVDAEADLLAFEAGRTLWVQRERCRDLARENDLTLFGWDRPV